MFENTSIDLNIFIPPHHFEIFKSFGYSLFCKTKSRVSHINRLQKNPVLSPRSEMPHFWSHRKDAAKPAAARQRAEEIPGILMSLPAAAVSAPLVDEAGKLLMLSFRDSR